MRPKDGYRACSFCRESRQLPRRFRAFRGAFNLPRGWFSGWRRGKRSVDLYQRLRDLWSRFVLVFTAFSSKKNVGRERIPSDFVDAALFAAQGVSCLRPRRGDCAGEKRTLLPVTSPVCAAFRVDLPRICVRGPLGTAVGDGRHPTRSCSRRRVSSSRRASCRGGRSF